MKMTKIDWVGEMFLATAIIGVVCYRMLPDWWCLLMWIPITLGYQEYHRRKLRR